ncbi:MAG: 4'-phosphopantetheinyl transferase superfamily protein, partial [Clostridia bacterium]|nr:4'-phosphopantetheinyl transferase superfamily protein [Clostridia bacterium]
MTCPSVSPDQNQSVQTSFFLAPTDPLRDAALLRDLLAFLPAERSSRILRMKDPETKRQSAAAWTLLRYALQVSGFPGCLESVIADENGKPYFKDSPSLRFNLSHSDRWALCGISSFEIGVDVEKNRENTLRLARRYFSEEENRYLDSLPESEKESGFTRLWTLKESYLKADGRGLSYPIRRLSLDLSSGSPRPVSDDARPCVFFEYGPEEGYHMSGCVLSPA